MTNDSSEVVETALRTRLRLAKGKLMVVLCALALALAVVPLGGILYEITSRGMEIVSVQFVTELPPSPYASSGGGVRNAMVGTVAVTALGTAISVPVGVLAGIYLSEFGDSRYARTVRFLTEVLSSTPSIIAGVAVYSLIVVPMGGSSTFAGGFALAILAIPWITIGTEDALALVPEEHRHGSLALGVDRTWTVLGVVLPEAVGGVITGTMLAVARIAGETAPLIWTVGNTDFDFAGFFEPTNTLSVSIYLYATSPYDLWKEHAWGAAFILVGFVLLTNVVARTVWNRRRRSIRGD